jgi:N-methylhydantoinase A
VREGADAVAPSARAADLLHGTTVATNALLERKGARTVLITDAGFEDLIEIARQDRPSLYDPMADRVPPLVERPDRVGWHLGLDLNAGLADHPPESVAIALLDSFRDGAGELALAEQVRAVWPHVPISMSHRVVGEFREFERFATTALNAYLGPSVARYLQLLGDRMRGRAKRVLVIRSNGGLSPAAVAAEMAATITVSGPAAGVMAAAACGDAHGWARVISFDMGGTSTDVCRIEDGQPEIGSERTIAGLTCRLPSVAVHTIGAGGGSLAWADSGGALRVGPHSAGAWPGPASYGRGGKQATVTDAHVVVGRLGSDHSLASGLLLDSEAAHRALLAAGDSLELGVKDTAQGVLEVVDALMERAIRRVTIEQGADPRQAALLAFGGAGGLHASSLARRIGMPAVLIPPHAGVFSALGLLLSPPRFDVVRTAPMNEGDGRLDVVLKSLLAEAAESHRKAMGAAPRRTEARADLRYRGQSHETTVSIALGEGWELLTRRFHQAHLKANGFSRPDEPVELVTFRAVAIDDPRLRWADIPVRPPQGKPELPDRPMPDGGMAARRWRPALTPGAEVIGPAAIEEPEATTWIGQGERAQVLEDGTLEITW